MDEKRIENLARFSEKHPGVDVTPLLKEGVTPPLNGWRVYLISILFPPFGLYYTVKYLFFDNDSDGKRRLGWSALILTIVVIGLFLVSFNFAARHLLKSQPSLPQNPTDLLNEYQDLVQ